MFHIHHNIKVVPKILMMVVEMILLAIAILVVEIMPVIGVVGDRLYYVSYSSSGHACDGVCNNERKVEGCGIQYFWQHNIQSLNFEIINRGNFGGFSSGSCAQGGKSDNDSFNSMGGHGSGRRF